MTLKNSKSVQQLSSFIQQIFLVCVPCFSLSAPALEKKILNKVDVVLASQRTCVK